MMVGWSASASFRYLGCFRLSSRFVSASPFFALGGAITCGSQPASSPCDTASACCRRWLRCASLSREEFLMSWSPLDVKDASNDAVVGDEPFDLISDCFRKVARLYK